MGKNVFELISKLPRHGIGAKLTRSSWKKGSFWTVVEARPSKDGAHGKVWGQLTWSGQLRHEKPTQINGPLKKVWRLVGSPGASGKAEQQRRQQWQSFAAAALQQQGAEPAAAAAAEATQ